MLKPLSHAALVACVLGVSVLAQAPQSTAANHSEPSLIRLRYASFDPLASLPEVPVALRSTAQQRLSIVQFAAVPTQADRDAIVRAGGEVIGYLPDDAYIVRAAAAQLDRLRSVASVRWVGGYHPAFRLDPELQGQVLSQPAPVRYNIVVADKHTDKPALMANIVALGGRVDSEQVGSLLIEATLTGPQLLQAAGLDQVLWIDRWSAPELDMNNARIQGGGNYVETQGGFTGTGVNAHIYEGVEATHPDFTGGATNVRSNGAAQTHGHATGGIVFGNGASNSAVRGMAPDAGKFYTNYNSVNGSRWQVFSDLVNIHDVSHTTASWGNPRTFFYTSISAEADDIVFDHDLPWTQSQSNAGNQDSRPQAWAKNVFSIGGVNHGNDSNPNNDSWQNGNASTGPASDGRIKPTLCAYYDNIGTSDRSGSAGYNQSPGVAGNWTPSFGGTSGATPIVAGHNVLAIEMFTDEVIPGYGVFGNQLRVPGGTTHENRPHFTTLKALQVVSANQYSFTSGSNDNRREHQGWGFPNLQNMWDNRAKTFIVDETDVLVQGQTHSWTIVVVPGEPSLKVSLNWAEPGANPSASQHTINNLSLRVTSPGGTVYWGNNNLENGVWSAAGGSEDTINSIENIFVQNPQAGGWNVEVIASAIVVDNHVETPVVDADYGLVVSGGVGTQIQFASFLAFGQGCEGSVPMPNPPCVQLNAGGGALTLDTSADEYIYRVGNSGPRDVVSFDIWTQSTGGIVNVPAYIYVGTTPGATPIASTTISVGATPGFYTATFPTPVSVSGVFYIGLDNTAQDIYLSNLISGVTNLAYSRSSAASSWALQIVKPSWSINCAVTFETPELSNNGLPVLGTTYDLTLSDAAPSAFAVLVSGLSDSAWSGGSLPSPLPGAPGCDLLVAPEALDAAYTTLIGTAFSPIVVPNTMGLIGLELFHQWAVLDAVNPLGIVLSNAGRATVGN